MPKLPNNTAEFYEALGLAIAQWSRVEDAFCDLFTRLTICSLTGQGIGFGPEKRLPESTGFFLLGNIFYSTTNFRGRLELLDSMMKKLVSDPELLAEWNAVKNKAGKLYARRNVLAHGTAWSGANAPLETMRYSIFSMQDQQMDFQQMLDATPSFYHYAERITQLAIDANAYLARREPSPQHILNQ